MIAILRIPRMMKTAYRVCMYESPDAAGKRRIHDFSW